MASQDWYITAMVFKAPKNAGEYWAASGFWISDAGGGDWDVRQLEQSVTYLASDSFFGIAAGGAFEALWAVVKLAISV